MSGKTFKKKTLCNLHLRNKIRIYIAEYFSVDFKVTYDEQYLPQMF